MRAMTSVPPPGGYGTTKRTGLAGRSCAHTGAMASKRRREKDRLAHRGLLLRLLTASSSNSAVSAVLNTARFRLDFREILRASSVSAQRADVSMSSQYRLGSLAPTSALNALSECAERAICAASSAGCFSFCMSFGDSTREGLITRASS